MRSPGRVLRAWATRLTIVFALVLVGGLSAACTNTSPATSGLPSLAPRCGAPVASRPIQRIPFLKAQGAGGPLVIVAVCVDGQGPFPFEVATGMGTSVMSPALRQELHLAATLTGASTVRGPTCVDSAPTVALRKFSVGGVALQPQGMLVASVPDGGATPAPRGIIGADVLVRFGAVRFDYPAKTVTAARPESTAPPANTVIIGQAKAEPPSAFVKSGPSADAVLSVVESPTATLISLSATFGATKAQLLVDTGSPRSVLAPAVVSAAGLSSASGSAPASGVGCSGTKGKASSGTWSAGTATLPPVSMVTESFTGSGAKGIDGTIGADVLSSYRSFVVDYGGAHLWLGVG